MILQMTERIRPNGGSRKVDVILPDRLSEKIQKILAAGYEFELEYADIFGLFLWIVDNKNEVDLVTEIVMAKDKEAQINVLIKMIEEFNFEEALNIIKAEGV